jgi:hypothetical protein
MRRRPDSLDALVRAARTDAPDRAMRRARAVGPLASTHFLREVTSKSAAQAAQTAPAGAAPAVSAAAAGIKTGLGALVLGIAVASVVTNVMDRPSRGAPLSSAASRGLRAAATAHQGPSAVEVRHEAAGPADATGVAADLGSSNAAVTAGQARADSASKAVPLKARAHSDRRSSRLPAASVGMVAAELEAPGDGARARSSPDESARGEDAHADGDPGEDAHPRRARDESAAIVAEAELIDSARRALRDNPRAALSLTHEHERRFPSGHARTERIVIRIEALLGLGRVDEARRLFESFETAEPNSLHLPRLRRALASF